LGLYLLFEVKRSVGGAQPDLSQLNFNAKINGTPSAAVHKLCILCLVLVIKPDVSNEMFATTHFRYNPSVLVTK
jgi:hypothetical protein